MSNWCLVCDSPQAAANSQEAKFICLFTGSALCLSLKEARTAYPENGLLELVEEGCRGGGSLTMNWEQI